jgi:sialate O-acetylesterase
MRRRLFALLSWCFSATELWSQPAASSTLRVARLFADGMVLQRQQPIVVWGWAPAGATIRVSLGRAERVARATAAGTWQVALPAMSAGGPFELRVRSANAEQRIRDVLVGDVWLASGQSNMEFQLSRAFNAADAVAHAADRGNASNIREFKVPVGYSYAPDDSLMGGAWRSADATHVGDFSAVAYFFARALRAAPRPGPQVPIGIINSTWGGSNIETWMSRRALRMSDAEAQQLRTQQDRWRDSVQRALRSLLGGLPTVDSGLVNGEARWAAPALDESSWRPVPVPGYWEAAGYTGMDGIGWYRTTFTLSDADAAAGITLRLDALDDDDITWVNGVEVGRTAGYNVPRRYVLPPRVLKAGRNQLTVRVSDGSGGGGINGAVLLQRADGSTQSLAGSWAFRVGQVRFEADGQVINKIPTVLYNRMMHPLLKFPVAGVLWYQGESNANNDAQAMAYRDQFAALVRSWRQDRGATVPFLWVQLPNFNPPSAEPPRRAAWALQRESMEAALALPRTGQAVIIDLGDSADIHPRNKLDVGERLARVARRVAYGEAVESSGPTYARHTLRGDTLVLTFDHVAGGLLADRELRGFAIAGDDRQFVWANARVQGRQVMVWHERVRRPVAVRYAWSNGPVNLSLRNTLGLPAAPFRTDRW